jgi:hypothetical protein
MVRCDSCGCNITMLGKRSLILPAMHVMGICICETCYFRLPYDLQREAKKVADDQSNKELSGYLVSALKALNKKKDLNRGTWFLVKDINARFQQDPPNAVYTKYIDGLQSSPVFPDNCK